MNTSDWAVARLNSATKYPSIPTYHGLDPSNGKLTQEVTKPRGPKPKGPKTPLAEWADRTLREPRGPKPKGPKTPLAEWADRARTQGQ